MAWRRRLPARQSDALVGAGHLAASTSPLNKALPGHFVGQHGQEPGFEQPPELAIAIGFALQMFCRRRVHGSRSGSSISTCSPPVDGCAGALTAAVIKVGSRRPNRSCPVPWSPQQPHYLPH